VEENRKVLVITDNSASSMNMAETIAGIVNGASFPGYSAAVIQADDFSGNNILPVHAFLLGCGEPAPASFQYIGELLNHINFAGRFCGVFSANSKAVKYLSGLIVPCEATTGKPLYAENGTITSDEAQNWLMEILKV